MAVAPIGLRDRDRGTSASPPRSASRKKLDRIRSEPRVALAYHAREHGDADRRGVRARPGPRRAGRATDARASARSCAARPSSHLGARPQRTASGTAGCASTTWSGSRSGCTWTGSPVWPDLRCAGEPELFGLPPAAPPDPQRAPAKGTGPRRGHEAGRRGGCSRPRTCCSLTWPSDGYPAIGPVDIRATDATGVELSAAPGVDPGRRPPRRPARPRLPAEADRPHRSPAHRLARGRRRQRPVRARTPQPASRPRPTRRCCCWGTGCRRSWACGSANKQH